MPKLKSNKAVSKRVRFTKSGRVKRRLTGRSHLLTGKRAKKKRLAGRSVLVDSSDQAKFETLLPYGK
jgi:large subunit ribosomal protein L35